MLGRGHSLRPAENLRHARAAYSDPPREFRSVGDFANLEHPPSFPNARVAVRPDLLASLNHAA